MRTIDLNCDMGEGFGPWTMGDDAAIMPHITSANIACGAHAGDPDVMLATVRLAKRHGVAVGAHPGYFDLRNFGRRPMQLKGDEVRAMLLYQLGALYGVARAEEVALTHVKPHGALYNQACVDRVLAAEVVASVALFSAGLPIVGLPGSMLEAEAHEQGVPFLREGFADRAYEPSGLLRDRKYPDALLSDPASAARNAVDLANGVGKAFDGTRFDLQVDTLCIHGDTPGAAAIAEEVQRALAGAGFRVAHGRD